MNGIEPLTIPCVIHSETTHGPYIVADLLTVADAIS